MIHVMATIQIEEGRRDAFLEEFHKIVPEVRAEAGCMEYGPAVDLETTIPAQPAARPHTVTVIEKWESLDALEAHLIAPHMLEYRKRVKHLVREAELRVLAPA